MWPLTMWSRFNLFGSFDWWVTKHWSGIHYFGFYALYHLIQHKLKRAQTSLAFTGLSWFIMQTLHVREDNSSPHESCLMTSCNAASVTVLQHSFNQPDGEIHLLQQSGFDLFCFLLNHIKTKTNSFIPGGKKLNREEDHVKFCGRSCSMKGNLSTFQLWHRWAPGRSYSEEAVLHLTPPPGFITTADWVWVTVQDNIISGQLHQAKLKQEKAKDKRKTSEWHFFCCTNYGRLMNQFANN